MKPTLFSLLLAIASFSALGETVQIKFDSSSPPDPGTFYTTNRYMEGGLVFKPFGIFTPDAPGAMIRNGGGIDDTPDNGTAYLQTIGVRSLEFFMADGSNFDLLSIDLAEASTFFSFPQSFTFIGYKHNGHTVTQTFTIDGTIDGTGPLADFQTFEFDKTWKQIEHVQLQQSFFSLSVDNLVIDRKHSR